MRFLFTAALAFIITVNYSGVCLAEESNPSQTWSDAPSVYVSVDAKTWMTRGRLLYDIQGSLFKKLASAGFPLVRDHEEAHDVTLHVLYREERGEEYDIHAYGTIIRTKFTLEAPQADLSWGFDISEISSNSVSGTPPYLDALEKFQSNPYYFFFGNILRGHIQYKLDLLGGLAFSLEQILPQENGLRGTNATTRNDSLSPPELHSMRPPQELYEGKAVRRAIDEYLASGDRRIVPVLIRLLRHRETAVRGHAVEALGTFQVQESRPYLYDMSRNDTDPQVRQTAKAVYRLLGQIDPPS